ncbi:hypothetical protein V6N13_053967 [Hibiscus sabdariffa]|uniref:Uncharacterized protein n=1 Tax=Hibiscus sabdariffa TaxID=183260 RepID=A0ABR2T6B9_9ROSI
MAKSAFVLLFSLLLLLSIQSAVGDDDEDAQNTSEFSDATGERLVKSLEKAAEKVKTKATSLTEWTEEKIKSIQAPPPVESPPESSQAPSFPRSFGPSRLVPIDDGAADADSGGSETAVEPGGFFPPTSSRPFGPGTAVQIGSGGLTPQVAPETASDEGGLNPQDVAPEMAIAGGGLIPQDLAAGAPMDEGGLVPQDLAPGMPNNEGGLIPQDLAPGVHMEDSADMPSGAGGSAADMPSGEGGSAADMPSGAGGSAADMPSGEGGSAAEMPSSAGGSAVETPGSAGGSAEETPGGADGSEADMAE